MKEKIKKIVRKIVNLWKNLPISIKISYLFCFLYGVFFYNCFNYITLYDTGSYRQAAEGFLEGHVDLLRTPIYPLFLYICEQIYKGKDVVYYTALTQIIIFYISIFFFHKLLNEFTSNKVILTMGTIFYGCFSPIIVFNTMLLTESLSVTTTVIFALILVKYTKTKKLKYLTASAILALFQTMLRPSGLYLFIVVGIVMLPYLIELIKNLVKKVKTQRKNYIPLIVFIVCILALLRYMSVNMEQNHYFGLSYVSEMNKFYDVVQAEIWKDNSDMEMVQSISDMQANGYGVLGSAIETEKSFRNLEERPERLINFNKEAISNHKMEYVTYLVDKSIRMGENNMLYNLSMDSGFMKEGVSRNILWIGDFLDCNVNFVYLSFVLIASIILTIAFTRKTILWDYASIALLIGGQLGVNILAGPAEFHRLNVPCYPFSLLVILIITAVSMDALIKPIPKIEKEKPKDKKEKEKFKLKLKLKKSGS